MQLSASEWLGASAHSTAKTHTVLQFNPLLPDTAALKQSRPWMFVELSSRLGGRTKPGAPSQPSLLGTAPHWRSFYF